MAQNTLDGTMSQWAWCGSGPQTYIHLCKRCLVLVTFGIVLHEVFTSDMQSTWGIAMLLKLHMKLAHSSKLWPYVGYWAKSRGWMLFCEWALFPEATVIMFAACVWFRQQICKILSVNLVGMVESLLWVTSMHLHFSQFNFSLWDEIQLVSESISAWRVW